MFTIIFYPCFYNIRNILQELHLLLAAEKEHKKVFPFIKDIYVVGFFNAKGLKDYIPQRNSA